MTEKKTIKKSSESTTATADLSGEQYASGIPERVYDSEVGGYVFADKSK